MKAEVFDHITDKQLWKEFQKGNRSAYAYIYDNYFDSLFEYGHKITPDINFIEDGIQELFVELWKSRKRLGEVSSIRFYLFKALRRKLIRNLTQQKGNPLNFMELNDNLNFSISLSIEETLINEQTESERSQRLEQALQSLSKRQKEIIYLKFYAGLSYQEIADVMALEMKSTYNLFARAMEALRQQFSLICSLYFAFLSYWY
ncbi:sigma-70 family RNA polymerase sigma factor [Rapidithrix thailandica]|uniref:Sigma-70 family RNA polymerase sigma factor n=1 Tax=Rapidithrix thailandica TaxID=413964 RepID=A0AAW9SB06_9BACT